MVNRVVERPAPPDPARERIAIGKAIDLVKMTLMTPDKVLNPARRHGRASTVARDDEAIRPCTDYVCKTCSFQESSVVPLKKLVGLLLLLTLPALAQATRPAPMQLTFSEKVGMSDAIVVGTIGKIVCGGPFDAIIEESTACDFQNGQIELGEVNVLRIICVKKGILLEPKFLYTASWRFNLELASEVKAGNPLVMFLKQTYMRGGAIPLRFQLPMRAYSAAPEPLAKSQIEVDSILPGCDMTK